MPKSETHALVYRARGQSDAALAVQQLKAEGIAVTTMGGAHMAFGELPADVLEVELWVEKADEARALARLVEFDRERKSDGQAPWVCACGEANHAGFDICWSCREPRRRE